MPLSLLALAISSIFEQVSQKAPLTHMRLPKIALQPRFRVIDCHEKCIHRAIERLSEHRN